MRKLFTIPLALLATGLLATATRADTLWDFQAVNEMGVGTHPKVNAPTDPGNRVVVEGVALAGVNEILDPDMQYTIFIQDENTSRGGIQGWAGSWLYGALWGSLRASSYVDFQAGDRVRLTGFLADAARGKVVMNHRHSASPSLVWTVEVLGHAGLPDPLILPSAHHANTFDATRTGGGERYQTRLVMLDGAVLSGGSWGNGQMVTAADASGQMNLLLSAMGDFTGSPAPSGPLNVIGIFDQEDTVAPHTSDYRIWVKKMEDVAMSVGSCRQAALLPAGTRVALLGKTVSRTYDGYLAIQDADRSGGILVVSQKEFQPGDVVTVQGIVTNHEGQPAIHATYLFAGGTPPKPLFVNSRSLWAEDGLSADGLLVSAAVTMGTPVGGGMATLADDAGKPILARVRNWSLPPAGASLVLSGVLGREQGTPVLYPADLGDFRVVE